jgi:hypothetical protein
MASGHSCFTVKNLTQFVVFPIKKLFNPTRREISDLQIVTGPGMLRRRPLGKNDEAALKTLFMQPTAGKRPPVMQVIFHFNRLYTIGKLQRLTGRLIGA